MRQPRRPWSCLANKEFSTPLGVNTPNFRTRPQLHSPDTPNISQGCWMLLLIRQVFKCNVVCIQCWKWQWLFMYRTEFVINDLLYFSTVCTLFDFSKSTKPLARQYVWGLNPLSEKSRPTHYQAGPPPWAWHPAPNYEILEKSLLANNWLNSKRA